MSENEALANQLLKIQTALLHIAHKFDTLNARVDEMGVMPITDLEGEVTKILDE